MHKKIIRTLHGVLSIGMLLGVFQSADALEYHGFRINESLLPEAQRAHVMALITPSLIGQINLMESVGLGPGVLDAFKRETISIDPTLQGMMARYMAKFGEESVRIAPVVIPADRPVLLFGLLHMYAHKYLRANQPEINKAYKTAREETAYPANFITENFLENPANYFVFTSMIYLVGNIQQPPYNCAVLSRSDPQYLEFLAGLFGPHTCAAN